MVKITAVCLLTIICILDFGMCLFYTDSKENDYPRIGKRRHFDELVYNNNYQQKYREPKKTMDPLTLSEAVIPSVLLFQYFDLDKDGFISAGEFSRRISTGLSYLMQREMNWDH